MRINKRCPRCNYKMNINLMTCTNCQLNFNKFNEATNRDAKKAIREKRQEDCVMRTGCPKDVFKWKLLLITIFLGFTGAHNYYVGRYKRGIGFSIFFVIGVVNAFIVTFVPSVKLNGDLWQVFYLLVLGWGAVLILWIFDIFNVIFNRYKIPVSRDV